MPAKLPNYNRYNKLKNLKRALLIGGSAITLVGATVGISTCAKSCSREQDKIKRISKMLSKDAEVNIGRIGKCEYYKDGEKYYVTFNCDETAPSGQYEDRRVVEVKYSVTQDVYKSICEIQGNGDWVFPDMYTYDSQKGDLIELITQEFDPISVILDGNELVTQSQETAQNISFDYEITY